MKSAEPLGRPAGNWLERGLGDLVGQRSWFAHLVDRVGLVPRAVGYDGPMHPNCRSTLTEHPDSPALGVNIGTTATVDEAVAMGRRFLDEAAAHDRPKDGIWVWYTRPSGALGRIYVEPEVDQTPPGYDAFHGPLTRVAPAIDPELWGGTWTPDEVNSSHFTVSPSEAASAIVDRPWDAAVPENPRTEEGNNMQDEKLADRLLREEREAAAAKLDRERDLERSAPRRSTTEEAIATAAGASTEEIDQLRERVLELAEGRPIPDWLRTADDTPRDPGEWICSNPDCGHKRRDHYAGGAGHCTAEDCGCEDFNLHHGGVVKESAEQKPITVLGPTRAKVHIVGDGTSRNTTVGIVLEDGTEIPISNVTRVKVEQGVGGPGHAEVETVMVENPIDVVLDANIGPKPITELRVVVDDDTPASLMHSGPKFVGLQDQDGKPVGCFSWFSEETGKRQLRIPIKPWPGEGRDKLEDEFAKAVGDLMLTTRRAVDAEKEVDRLEGQIGGALPALRACEGVLSMQARDAIAVLGREAKAEPQPGITPEAGVESYVETARRLLAEVRLTLSEGLEPSPRLGEALGALADAINVLETGPVVPGGLYEELRLAIARGDAGADRVVELEAKLEVAKASLRDYADALLVEHQESGGRAEQVDALLARIAEYRGAIAEALPTIRRLVLVAREKDVGVDRAERRQIAELERAAVGERPGTSARIAELERCLEALGDKLDRQRGIMQRQDVRLRQHGAASRVLTTHLQDAWWVEAASALRTLRDLTERPSHRNGAAENSAEAPANGVAAAAAEIAATMRDPRLG